VARNRADTNAAETDSDDEALTTNERAGARSLTSGLWKYPLIAIGTAGIGLLVAFLLIWLGVTAPANEHSQARVHAAHAQMFVSYLNARTAALRQQMDTLASSPDVVTALGSYDAATIDAMGEQLTRLVPYAQRVDVIAKGKAAVDLNAATPISFAALDVIKRAETQEFVGPESSQVNQRPVFYVARPITDARGVNGVLFAAISMDYYTQPLKSWPNDLGQVAVEQQFEGTASRVVLQYGVDSGSAPLIRKNLDAAHWQLTFKPNPAAAEDVIALSSLLTPLLVAIALLLAGIYLCASRLFSAMDKDANQLIEYVTRVVRGRASGNVDRYRLVVFQQVATAAGRFARRVPRDKSTPAAARTAPAKTAVATKGKAATKREVAPPPDDDDDFLDVRSNVKDDNFGIEVSEEVSPIDLGLELDPQVFRAYDIRGIIGKNLTPDLVYWIGRAFAAEAAAASRSRVVIGRDGRHSSEGLAEALTRGLREGGADVMDVGQVPTPLLYYATHALDTGTGVMITGSHNPPEYNGLKMMIAGVTLAEDRIQRLRERIVKNELSSGDGDLEQVDIVDHYLDRVIGDVAVAQPLKVVIDAGNGVAGAVAPRLLSELGCEVVPLYCDVDGDFPNHHPDPADPANLEDLITVVKSERADIGLAFDGDGDRLGVVTNTGEIVWPDKLLMLFARDIVGRNPGADIIYDVKCSRHLNAIISEHGGRPIMWKTGHSHMKAKLRETGALLAGEFSGHICFGERWYGFDDALYSAARLVEILGAESEDAAHLFAGFPVTFSTPEIKINTTEKRKFEVVEQLTKQGDFGNGTVTTIDGIRVDYPDGFGLIRPSNTSPVLTLRFEADGQSALDRIQRIFREQLAQIDPSLKF
jgi:phosphomannomutase/phosphoglucomutase